MVAAPATVVAAVYVLVMMMASVVVLLVAPAPAAAADGECDPLRDVVVKETAGGIQLDGAKKYGVTVVNQAGAAAVSGVHLACGYDFRHVDDDVDPRVLVQVAHGDCLLLGGGAIAPGRNVSFAYTSYVRYDMHVIAATCATVPSSHNNI
ncbi:TPD1 protein homolog 1A-like [Sorghum bicolor]|uniref:Uncharacterized protein n=1 Tax=Sorghum bicolor TaxID=4558 RepID=A0A1Z5RI86_SORBI|nr:TPD1 protein homolog 1A-like [Sorghum bicolor]OQU83472.1 hypothetical protein SORBI_3005G122850 [Sorghum bicolor]|eukprot:XP_021317744.1 TPD1 protein homolog 1A-like [Sorghum bicolor]